MTPTPQRPAPIAAPLAGLTTNLDAALRHVLRRVDASRATPASVRAALAVAGVSVSLEWAGEWLQRAAEIRKGMTDEPTS